MATRILNFQVSKKSFKAVFLPNLQKSADSRAIRAQSSSSAAQQRKGPPSAYRRKWHSRGLHMTAIGVQHVVQDIHMVQHRTGTLGHAVQRVLGHMDVNAGLALDQLDPGRAAGRRRRSG